MVDVRSWLKKERWREGERERHERGCPKVLGN